MTERFDEVFAKALSYILDIEQLGVEAVLQEATLKTESPIEGLFALAMVAVTKWSDYEWDQQVQIGPYRVDVLITMTDLTFSPDSLSLVVELDGHDFHEKTKEQARQDKKRDRALMELGYPVVRFAGSEVWADPFECAREALRLLATAYWNKHIEPKIQR